MGRVPYLAWIFQIRIAFGLAFPPGDLIISRVLGKRLGYYSLCGGFLPGGRSGLLLFLLLTSGLSFLRKDNQRKGKSEWVRLSHGGESQTRKDNRRMRASLG